MTKTKTKTKAKKSPAKKKSNHLTEVLNAVTLKTPCEYKPKEFSAFVLSLFLSEDPELRHIVNDINNLQFNLTDELIYKYYVKMIPKGRRYLKFTKKSVESKQRDIEIKELMEKYDVSKREASLSLTERKN